MSLITINTEDRAQIVRLYDQMWRVSYDSNQKPEAGSEDYETDVSDLQAALILLAAEEDR